MKTRNLSNLVNILFGIGMGLAAILCCAPILGTIIVNSDYGATLPIDFANIQPTTPLDGVYYEIDYADQNIVLKSTRNQTTLPIVEHYSPVALPPAYHMLSYDQHHYLIVRLASGGNSGANWFRVWSFDPVIPVDLTAKALDPNAGLSCIPPVLVENSLKFIIAPDCAADSSDTSSGFQTYWLALRG